ncbi:MAG: hypothetical protein GC184_03975 [Rhizobiales bacterium]|nr:hypothetical protein [Hyphomicrobiales bacterium]
MHIARHTPPQKRPALLVLLALSSALSACAHRAPPDHMRRSNFDTPEKLILAPADLNGDGKITRDEVKAYVTADMKRADTNHDGHVSASEGSDWNMAEASVTTGLTRAPVTDWTGDGIISFDEFGAAIGTAFDQLDSNKDGIVTQDELNQPVMMMPDDSKNPSGEKPEGGTKPSGRRK